MAEHASDPVARLIQWHAADGLRSYRGNLAAAVHAIGNNWVPAEDAPGVPEFVNILRKHLADTGDAEDDSFLLRWGLTAPGLQRGIIPPLMVLEENRGGFSARRQREAEGQVRRLAEALAIGRFFCSNLAADTQQAVVELADRCERLSTGSDGEKLSQFRELSPIQAEQLEAEAMRCIDATVEPCVDVGTRLLQHLACYRDNGLSEATCDALITRGIFWPSSLYREASEAAASRLVERIDNSPEQGALNLLLLALAWTRTDAALRAFRRWSQESPPWAALLHAPPEDSLLLAGWCLDEAGDRHDLVYADCFRLVGPRDSATATDVVCRKSLSDPCPSCGGPQAWLFDFTRVDKIGSFAAFADAPRRILCCLHCACYGTVFTRYTPDGEAEWLSPMEPNAFAYDGSPEPCRRTMEATRFPAFACTEPFELNDASTIGGIPMWLQDDEFPRCIECGRWMTFLAQHDNGPLGEEGIYYAFHCGDCRVAAVTYQ